MQKKWIVKPKADQTKAEELIKTLNIDPNIINLLINRGIDNYEKAKIFFRPKLEDLHNPFLMKDMDSAVGRLTEAIINKERILLFGDYDVDGTTAVSLMYLFLIKYTQNIGYYIPDRYEEGYGISRKGIDYAKQNNFTLIIALDCGIKAVDKVEYASELNIDFIICDHHTADAEIPKAIAVLDPKRSDCNYPFKELSGCGVGFKLLQAYCLRNNISFDELFYLLDILTISIAADIVPIIGENRILAHYGLIEINKKQTSLSNNEKAGITALRKIANVENKVLDISDVVFKFAPRINAAGRIRSGSFAVQLFVENTENMANEFSHQIEEYNNKRKSLDEIVTNEAITMIERDLKIKNRHSTVLFNSAWHKGIVGIVASRVIEKYYRPTIILTESHGMASGSARSVEGFDLYEAINSCADILHNFGGHKYAAGLTLKIENIEEFRERFDNYVKNNISSSQKIEQLNIDDVITFKDITYKFFKILKQFQPFGPENMTPIFMTQNVYNTGNSRLVGTPAKHIKFELVDPDGLILQGIGFNMAEHFSKIMTKKPFNICYSIDENQFNGTSTLQLNVRDIHFEN